MRRVFRSVVVRHFGYCHCYFHCHCHSHCLTWCVQSAEQCNFLPASNIPYWIILGCWSCSRLYYYSSPTFKMNNSFFSAAFSVGSYFEFGLLWGIDYRYLICHFSYKIYFSAHTTIFCIHVWNDKIKIWFQVATFKKLWGKFFPLFSRLQAHNPSTHASVRIYSRYSRSILLLLLSLVERYIL